MYPILILRSEFICLVILIFLFFISRAYNIIKESKSFRRILIFAIVHVIFDIITVLTVNNLDVVPSWLNWICHVIFYISAILFSYEVEVYVINICYPRISHKLYPIGHIITTLYIFSLSFLKIEYVPDIGTNSSAGPAAIVGYGVAFLFFMSALVILFIHIKQVPISVKNALIPMMLVLMVTEAAQIIWRSVLFTGGAITIVTVGFFFSLENPVEVFKKKAMTDALTGVQSRRSFEEEIEALNKQFVMNPGNEYSFVFCDINDLRAVNNRYGHDEGDHYITLIASAIKACMKSSKSIYRFGGDEFLVLYVDSSDDIIQAELKALRKECQIATEGVNYEVSVATGYATSSDSYDSLHEVIKSADFAMYQNKAIKKMGNNTDESVGIKLNYNGLTDHLFDAMCASNDMLYPFITNMNTNVTRISPKWKEYFGLDAEFYADFLGTWKDRIHPDYFGGYVDDVAAVLNEHKQYHNYDYPARRLDGKYVMVSCHGSLFHDSSTDTSFFAGYIINSGKEYTSD